MARKVVVKPSKGKVRIYLGKKKPTKRKSALRSEMARVARRVMNKGEEIKQQTQFYTQDQSILFGNSAAVPPVQFFTTPIGDVLNQIVQGTGQGDRIGNKISLRNMIVKGVVYTNSTTGPNGTPFGITGPVYVDVYLGYRRDLQPVDTGLSQLFNDGDGWISPSGSSKDLLYGINTDKYVVLSRRRLKIGQNTYSTSTASYNDYMQHRTYSFNLKKFILRHSKVYYNDTTGAPSSPLWNALSVWITVINPATGLPFPSTYTGTQYLGVFTNYVSRVYYTDD